MSNQDPHDSRNKESLGLNMIPAIFGAGVGILIGDFTGLSAAAVTEISKWGLYKYISPLLSKREFYRLCEWAKQASEGIANRQANGEEFRQDGFFKETATNRSNIDEVIELTYKNVINIIEEPKIKFKASLFENVHFDPDLDIDTYRLISKYLEELTYRQLCIIKLCKKADEIDLESLGNSDITSQLVSILRDFDYLSDTGVVTGVISRNNPLIDKIRELYMNRGGDVWMSGGSNAEIPGYVNQSENKPSEIIFKYAGLDQIPDEDVDEILNKLKKR